MNAIDVRRAISACIERLTGPEGAGGFYVICHPGKLDLARRVLPPEAWAVVREDGVYDHEGRRLRPLFHGLTTALPSVKIEGS
jgi:hypothetical protein